MPTSPIAVFNQYSGGNASGKGVTGNNQAVSAKAGVVRKISVTTVLPGAGLQVWDGKVSGDAIAGNLIYNNPTALAAGTVIDLNWPVNTGILVSVGAGVVSVSYN